MDPTRYDFFFMDFLDDPLDEPDVFRLIDDIEAQVAFSQMIPACQAQALNGIAVLLNQFRSMSDLQSERMIKLGQRLEALS